MKKQKLLSRHKEHRLHIHNLFRVVSRYSAVSRQPVQKEYSKINSSVGQLQMPNKTECENVKAGKDNVCAVCGEFGEKTCAACKSVFYCSVSHQKSHWKKHKTACCPFLIKNSEVKPENGEGQSQGQGQSQGHGDGHGLGMEWVAARDLKPNTFLCEELPVLRAPLWSSKESFESPACLTCGVRDLAKGQRCQLCHWPICSVECQRNELHAENECKLLGGKLAFPPPSHEIPGYYTFLLYELRAHCLKRRDRPAFQQLVQLQDFHQLSGSNERLKELSAALKNQRTLLNRQLYSHSDASTGDPEAESLTDEELEKVARIARVNAFLSSEKAVRRASKASSTNYQPVSVAMERTNLLYVKFCRMNHSCAPNCQFFLTPSPEFKVHVRTVTPVTKGEPLTISYYNRSDFLMMPTSQRQQEMQKVGGFLCQCSRCLDPTELGSFISAIKCHMCQLQEEEEVNRRSRSNSGYFLPQDPPIPEYSTSPYSSDPLYQCNRCGNSTSQSNLLTTLPPAARWAFHKLPEFDLSRSNPEGTEDDEEGSGPFPIFQVFLHQVDNEDLSELALHPNHWTIQLAYRKVVDFHLDKLTRMSKVELECQARRLKHILTIEHKLLPGPTRSRGNNLNLLASTLLQLILQQQNQIQSASALVKRSEAMTSWLKTCEQLQKEALEIMRIEPRSEMDFEEHPVVKNLMGEIKLLQRLQLLLQNQRV